MNLATDCCSHSTKDIKRAASNEKQNNQCRPQVLNKTVCKYELFTITLNKCKHYQAARIIMRKHAATLTLPISVYVIHSTVHARAHEFHREFCVYVKQIGDVH